MKVFNLTEGSEDFTGNIWYAKNDAEDVLIDAGTGDSWENIKQLSDVDKVVVTHSHYDHVDNLSKIVEEFDPKVFAFEPENIQIEARKLDDGEVVEICGKKFEVFHTPGHKDDSICLYSQGSGVLFTGDLIFPEGGFGRTDLDEGDRDELINSIEKISELDVSRFYPGHDDAVEDGANESIEKSLAEARKKEPKY